MLPPHAAEDSDDNDGNDELMEFDRNACFYMLCTTAPSSREGEASMTHGISAHRGQEGITTSAVSHGGSEASQAPAFENLPAQPEIGYPGRNKSLILSDPLHVMSSVPHGG